MSYKTVNLVEMQDVCLSFVLLSTIFIIVVTQKLVLQPSKNVTAKCTENLSPLFVFYTLWAFLVYIFLGRTVCLFNTNAYFLQMACSRGRKEYRKQWILAVDHDVSCFSFSQRYKNELSATSNLGRFLVYSLNYCRLNYWLFELLHVVPRVVVQTTYSSNAHNVRI